nr:hypothetical protein [uncultured Dyadobacter sp.]
MIEVFKTDVQKKSQANLLTDLICLAFSGYQASFDLEDCDKVLRVSSCTHPVCCMSIIGLLENFGYSGEVLNEQMPEELTEDEITDRLAYSN